MDLKYNVTFTFNDEKTIAVSVEKERIDTLFHTLGHHKIFWTDDLEKGFWLDLEQVRYIIFKQEEEK